MRKYNMKGGRAVQNRAIHGRTMMLTKATKKALKAQLDYMATEGFIADDDYVFQTQRGGNRPLAANGYWRTMYDAKQALGWTWKLSAHSMRKTFAARVYDELLSTGNPDSLRILGKALGHENLNNTDRYLSFREDELNSAISNVFGE